MPTSFDHRDRQVDECPFAASARWQSKAEHQLDRDERGLVVAAELASHAPSPPNVVDHERRAQLLCAVWLGAHAEGARNWRGAGRRQRAWTCNAPWQYVSLRPAPEVTHEDGTALQSRCLLAEPSESVIDVAQIDERESHVGCVVIVRGAGEPTGSGRARDRSGPGAGVTPKASIHPYAIRS